MVNAGNLNKDADSKAMQKLVLIACDLMVQLAPELQSMTIMANLEGFSISKNVDFNKAKDCINILNMCLPEVLRRAFVLNAPMVFQVLLIADISNARILVYLLPVKPKSNPMLFQGYPAVSPTVELTTTLGFTASDDTCCCCCCFCCCCPHFPCR